MNEAPRSVLDQLREQYPGLSSSHRIIAQFVISHTAHSAFLPITRLAELTGVSAATIVRFAQLLGYSGYPDFQAAVQGLVLDQIGSNAQIDDLRTRMDGVLSGEVQVDPHQLMRMVLLAQAEHLTRLADAIGKDDFAQTVSAILEARRVYVVGLRLSSAPATALWHGLHLLRPHVMLVTGSSGFLADQIADCGQDDLLIGFSYRRYAADTIRAMKLAKQRGAQVIAMTDQHLSPAAVVAHLALVTPVIMQLSHIPLAPSLALVSALLESVALAIRARGGADRAASLAKDAQSFELFTRGDQDFSV
jgi:DNA-binding MurR/RpiR family transcriptional regulator